VAREVVDSVFDAIVTAAAKSDHVSLVGFGKFKITYRSARAGRNPQNGEPINLPASRKVSFVAAKTFKDKLT
jgi:nucleoid DNA-binding protein